MSNRGTSKSSQSKREPVVRVGWVRVKISKVRGRLRVLIYARYSTDEQNPRSIDAQIGYCKRFLKALGVTDAEIIVLYDAGISGEKISRPGINQVRTGIDAKQFDLILAEDSSRLFRNAMACVDLVQGAVDQGIRVICLNDEVDTADEEYWEDRLYEAARHHEKANRFTAKRIKRAHEDLWEMGAAIGLLKPGYRRKPTHPATDREPEEGPYFDEIDEKQSPIIEEAYLRIAAKEMPGSVGEGLTKAGLPKTANCQLSHWTDKNVVALIRRTDYRGFQSFRTKFSKKKYRKGTRTAERNTADKILTREMPKLRIVPDWLWFAANKAIDERRRCKNAPCGEEHPLHGIPRNSRGPLSEIFVCKCCEEKMRRDGHGGGGYRCSQVDHQRCWNKATSDQRVTHDKIGGAIIHALRSLGERLDRLLQRANDLLADDGRRQARRSELQEEKRNLETVLQNLNNLAEKAKECPETLLTRMQEREADLAQLCAELDGLACESECFIPPTRKEVEDRIEQIIEQLRRMDRTCQQELKLLVGQIQAVPCQQFDTNLVVLRARFQLRLAALLPFQTRAALAARCDGPIEEQFESIPMLVDLLKPSTGPKYGLEALKLKEKEDLGPTAIGRRLEITKRRASLAVKYGNTMRNAGVTDPYSELMEPPAAASRWRPRGFRKAQQNKEAQ